MRQIDLTYGSSCARDCSKNYDNDSLQGTRKAVLRMADNKKLTYAIFCQSNHYAWA